MGIVSKNTQFLTVDLCRKLTEQYDESLKNYDALIILATITSADPSAS
jgi:hypothetical protein